MFSSYTRDNAYGKICTLSLNVSLPLCYLGHEVGLRLSLLRPCDAAVSPSKSASICCGAAHSWSMAAGDSRSQRYRLIPSYTTKSPSSFLVCYVPIVSNSPIDISTSRTMISRIDNHYKYVAQASMLVSQPKRFCSPNLGYVVFCLSTQHIP